MSIISAQKFAKIINDYSYISYVRKDNAPLTNVTFFLGAGFSKAWDIRYPLANELFHFKHKDLWSLLGDVSILFHDSGQAYDEDITPDTLKEIVYHLNMELKYHSVRTRYLDENSILFSLSRIKCHRHSDNAYSSAV
jgi:hypothetical protein